jgi:hypothetical protein
MINGGIDVVWEMNQQTVQVDGTSEVKYGFLVGDGKESLVSCIFVIYKSNSECYLRISAM